MKRVKQRASSQRRGASVAGVGAIVKRALGPKLMTVVRRY